MKKISFSVLIGALLFMIFSGAANIVAADATIPTEKDLRLFEWRSIGPYTFSGRITDFAVPKGQSQVYYVATATGGIWKTEDSGIHFEPIFDEYGNMSMGNIAVAPSTPDIVYAATGEALHARSSAHGNGMWKSTNGGRTWKHIGLEESYFIPKIAVDSENPDIVYVAAEGKLYDNKMDCQRGLYKTTDGGEHWEQVLDLKDRGVGDFVIDPNNSDIVIAIAYKTYRRTWTFIDRQPGNHVYKSIDGGKTWKKLTNGLPLDIKTGWNGICMYPKDPNIVYVRMDEEVNLGFAEGEGSYLFREGRVFKNDFYFNKFKHYEINSKIMKLIEFEPIAAEDEEELVEQLNEYIKDKDFINRLKVNIEEFNSKARSVYRRNEDIIETIDEIEKTLKRDREEQLEYEKVNRFILTVLLKDSEGVEIKENRINIVDLEKVQIHPEFKKLVKFSPKGIKNVKELAQNIEEFVKNRELRDKLGLEFKDFNKQARKIYKDNEEVLNQLEEVKKKIRKFKNTEGRYQTMNRYILQILYADALQKMEPVKKAGVIYKSEDQGETWTRQTEYKLVGGSQVVNQIEAGYSGRIEVDPNDSDKLYAVEVIVKISKDGGKTFKNASWIGTHKCHVDTRGMWIDPLNSDHILNGNDGGVSETWDGGKHWSQKETISAQQFYDISVDNQLPYNVMGGTQDNGCWIGPSRNRNSNGVFPADWTYLPSGDGFYVVRNWWNPEYIYFESQFGWSRRMNFRTGEMISLSKRNSDEERAAGKPPQRYQWDSPIILSPHNPGIVYVCSQHVHRSLTRGDRETFVTISPDLSKNNKERIELSKKTNLQYATIYTFAESPVKPGVYWAGTDDGNLQLSTNGGNTWQNITKQFYNEDGTPKKGIEGDRIPYDRWVMRVTPSAHDPKTCYVAYSGYRTHNEDNTYIYVTHDLGKTWKDLSNGMMNPVNDIEEDPDNSNVLYLATDYGVFVSIDKGENWVDMSASAPDVIMMDIDIQERERDLAVATYGRGFYIVDIYPFKDFGEEVFQKDAYLFDIQRVIKWNMLERRGAQYGEFAKVTNPPIGASIYYYIKQPVKSAFIVIKDLEGNEIQKRNVKAVKGIHSYFWNLRKQLEDDDNARSWRRGAIVEPGTFTVSLVIDDKEVETKGLKVLEDTLKYDKNK